MNKTLAGTDQEPEGSNVSPKIEPAFFPDTLDVQEQKFNRRSRWVAVGVVLFGFVVFGIMLVVFFEAVLPDMTQRVINNADLQMQDIIISDPTEDGFRLDVDALLMRDTKLPATMHDTELSVYVGSTEPLQPGEGSRMIRRMQDKPDVADEVFLGVLKIPETYMNGYNTTIAMGHQFEISSQEAFDSFAVELIQKGKSRWHIVGKTVVTVAGKTVTGLDFNKVVDVLGPSFMQDQSLTGSEESGKTPVELPKVTSLATNPLEEGFEVLVNMTVQNPSATTMDPLGAVRFELSWEGIILGDLETEEISILPGENNLSLSGMWTVADMLSGLDFFTTIKVTKKLTNLSNMGARGEPVYFKAVGVACSSPLYDEAVKAISAEFKIDNFDFDLMGSRRPKTTPSTSPPEALGNDAGSIQDVADPNSFVNDLDYLEYDGYDENEGDGADIDDEAL